MTGGVAFKGMHRNLVFPSGATYRQQTPKRLLTTHCRRIGAPRRAR
jgi:hypothetical protein